MNGTTTHAANKVTRDRYMGKRHLDPLDIGGGCTRSCGVLTPEGGSSIEDRSRCDSRECNDNGDLGLFEGKERGHRELPTNVVTIIDLERAPRSSYLAFASCQILPSERPPRDTPRIHNATCLPEQMPAAACGRSHKRFHRMVKSIVPIKRS